MRCPKSRFPIRIIEFDKLELIIYVSQGLTLSTASLVQYLLPMLVNVCRVLIHCSALQKGVKADLSRM